jgi:hypothetical protein
METLNIVSILAQAQNIIGGLIMVCSGVIVISLVIPGEQPEKFLKSAVDFLSKFSKK